MQLKDLKGDRSLTGEMALFAKRGARDEGSALAMFFVKD